MKKIFLTLFAAVVWALTMLGCEGDPGSPGVNRIGEDVYPPIVDIVVPMARQEIYIQTWLEAHVQDSGRIDSVKFLIDGVELQNQNLTIFNPPFKILWDCSGLSEGRHFIQAHAWDSQGHTGLSNWLMIVKKPIEAASRTDTVFFFDNSTRNSLEWYLPDSVAAGDTSRITGLGVRFLMNRPATVTRMELYVKKKDEWRGAYWDIEIRTVKDNLPDSLLFNEELDGSKLWRFEAPENRTIWRPIRVGGGVDVPLEFFILAKVAEDQKDEGDTLAILTDEGLWRNYHGVVQQNGEWRIFTSGPRIAFNPMIRIIVNYDQ